MAPALIYCADGNPAFARVAVESGWLYGARLPATVYQRVYFADQDWRRPDRGKYMAALAEHRPDVATVLDWERAEQEGEVMAWAEEASRHVRAVVVIPKVPGTVPLIPERVGGAEVVLGYSVPTSYGGSPVPLWEFGRRPVHLLGGSPQRQIELAAYLNVVSADGNMAHQQAHRCRFWSPTRAYKGRWVQLRDAGDERAEGANLEAFRRSCVAIRAAWQRRTPSQDATAAAGQDATGAGPEASASGGLADAMGGAESLPPRRPL